MEDLDLRRSWYFRYFFDIRSFRVEVYTIKNHQHLSWYSANTDNNFQLSALTFKYYHVSLEEGMHNKTSNMLNEDLHPWRTEKKTEMIPFLLACYQWSMLCNRWNPPHYRYLVVWIVSQGATPRSRIVEDFRGNSTSVILSLVSLVHSWFSIIVL